MKKVSPRYIAEAIKDFCAVRGYVELRNFWFGDLEELPAALEPIKKEGYRLLLDANKKVVGVSKERIE